MRQTMKSRYHDGVPQPLESLSLTDEAEVQVTVDTEAAVSADEILRRAAQACQNVSNGLVRAWPTPRVSDRAWPSYRTCQDTRLFRQRHGAL
jgi:hypothetical protein